VYRNASLSNARRDYRRSKENLQFRANKVLTTGSSRVYYSYNNQETDASDRHLFLFLSKCRN